MAEGNSSDWTSMEFRNKIRDKLELYIKQQSITLDATELETTVFERSSSQADYTSRLQSCLNAAKQKAIQQKQQQQQSSSNENNNMIQNNANSQQTLINNTNNNNNQNNTANINSNNNLTQHQLLLQQQQQQIMQQQQQQQMLQQQQLSDPMNALQHLTKQGLNQGQQGNQLLRASSSTVNPHLPQYAINRPPNQQMRGEMITNTPRMIQQQFVSGLSPQQFQMQQRNRQIQMHAYNQMSGSPGNALLQQQGGGMQQPLTPQQMMQQQMQQPSPAMAVPLAHQSMLTPSPSNHPMPSPAATISHLSPSSKLQLPSPGHAINTPANEDAEYLQKWEQLQRFIEPLKRTIHSLDKDGDRKLDLNKMKNLLDILSDKHKRLSLTTLLKCESVLERQLHMPSSAHTPVQPTIKPPNEGLIGEELLEVIEKNLDNPCLTHTLQRTFKKCMHPFVRLMKSETALIKSEKEAEKQRDEGKQENIDKDGLVEKLISHVERETSQLQVSITLGDQQLSGDNLLLICHLDREHLPQVPPLLVSLPIQYPLKTPTPILNQPLYQSSELFKRIKTNLSFDLGRLQHNYTLTTLLNTWESAVIKSCSDTYSSE